MTNDNEREYLPDDYALNEDDLDDDWVLSEDDPDDEWIFRDDDSDGYVPHETPEEKDDGPDMLENNSVVQGYLKDIGLGNCRNESEFKTNLLAASQADPYILCTFWAETKKRTQVKGLFDKCLRTDHAFGKTISDRGKEYSAALSDASYVGERGRLFFRIVDFYLESIHGVGKHSRIKIIDVVNKFLADLQNRYGVIVEKAKIRNIDGVKVQQLWNEMCSSGKKIKTMNAYVGYINHFLIWAYKMGYVGEDLSGIVKYQKVPDPESIPEDERVDRTYKEGDVARLIKYIEEKKNPTWLRDRAIVALFIYSGMRQEELTSLTIKQFRMHGKGKIYARRKGGSYKDIFVSEDCYPYIEAYLESRGHYSEDDPLFLSERKNHQDQPTMMDSNEIYRIISTYQKELQLPTGTHVLRHVFVSAVEKIGGAAVARDCANHKHLNITEMYDHSTEEQRKVAVNSLDYFGDKVAPALGGSSRQPFLSDLSGLTEEDRITLFDLASVLANGDPSTKQTLRTKINNLHSVFCDI